MSRSESDYRSRLNLAFRRGINRDGTWRRDNQSGAVPARDQHDMLSRVKKLIEAVKKAREQANLIDVENKHTGDAIFDFVFGKPV
jgi:hypothetical protein